MDTFFLLRSLCPADEPAYRALFARLSPEEIRWRFGHALTALPDAQVKAWCAPDGVSHLAWAAASPEGIHGVVRVFIDAPSSTAEFAILVERACQGQGLGCALAREAFQYLDALGIQNTVAMVAPDNTRMLRFASCHGFSSAKSTGWSERCLVRAHPGVQQAA